MSVFLLDFSEIKSKYKYICSDTEILSPLTQFIRKYPLRLAYISPVLIWQNKHMRHSQWVIKERKKTQTDNAANLNDSREESLLRPICSGIPVFMWDHASLTYFFLLRSLGVSLYRQVAHRQTTS